MREVHLELPIRLAVVEAERVRVTDDPAAHAAMEARAAACAAAFSPDGTGSPGAVDGVGAARRLFRALDIDPTKRRPSSEALLRRALRHQPMPRVNALVDALNLCSLETLLPLGLYDRDRIRGAIVLRRGRGGERYAALTGRELNLEGRYVLVDDAGPFGTPITDSERTAITPATTSCVVCLYAPGDYQEVALRAHAERAAACIETFCAGSGIELALFAGSPD